MVAFRPLSSPLDDPTSPPTLTLCNYSLYKITLLQFKGQPELGGAGGTGGTLLLMSPLFLFLFFFAISSNTFERAEEEINPPLPSTRPYIEAYPVCLFALVCFRAMFVCAEEVELKLKRSCHWVCGASSTLGPPSQRMRRLKEVMWTRGEAEMRG